MLFKTKSSTIFIIPPTYPTSSEQLALLSNSFPHPRPSLTMFMLYHVQQRMWLCDFDEFGLVETSAYPQSCRNLCTTTFITTTTFILSYLTIFLHSPYHYPTRLNSVCGLQASFSQTTIISLLSSYLYLSPTSFYLQTPLFTFFFRYQYTHHHFMSCSTLSWSV